MMKSKSDENKNIHSGHRQRVKERFLKAGLESFQIHEVLEFLLFFGIPYKDTNSLAHILIDKYGSFAGVCDAQIESLKEVPGMTENAAILIKALPSISGIYMQNKLQQSIYLGTLNACAKYLSSMLFNSRKEEMYVLFLDSEHKLLKHKKLAVGSIDYIPVILREIQEVIFFSNATNVIIAHNHPSGNIEPSLEDIRLTKHILESLSYIGVNLLDHIIVSGENYCSLKQKGTIGELKKNCASDYISKFAESTSTSKWLSE